MKKLVHALVVGLVLMVGTTLFLSLRGDGIRAGGRSIPARLLNWGVLLQTDKACYQVGEIAEVIHVLYNYTEADKMVFVGKFGGNGCSYRIEIRDEAGQLVWQPAGIAGGAFIPPRCSGAPSAPVSVPACGGRLGSAEPVSLVYQNPNGIGTLGAPLPPGFYNVIFTANFAGPHRDGTTLGRGFNPTASVPIQILP